MDINLEKKEVSTTYNQQRTLKKNAKKWLRILLKSKTGTLGFLIVSLVVLVAIFANFLAPYNPATTNLNAILQPPMWAEGGSSKFILGTDNLGRDILSRIIYGARISILVGVFSVIIAGIIGLIVGVLAGYFGGILDSLLMRLVDSFIAIPNVLFILVVLSVFEPSLLTLIFVIGFTNWVTYARVVRGEVLSIKERDFVKASKSIGTKNLMIMIKHIIPNIISTFIVISTLSVATTIVLEASLSFLGLGIKPPDVSWGGMLTDGRNYLATNWWLATFPGIAITVTVLGIIFLGDWLRDILDPRTIIKK